MSSRDTVTNQSPLAIGEVARVYGVSVDTIREWESAGKIPASFRTPGNQRRWDAEDIESARGVA